MTLVIAPTHREGEHYFERREQRQRQRPRHSYMCTRPEDAVRHLRGVREGHVVVVNVARLSPDMLEFLAHTPAVGSMYSQLTWEYFDTDVEYGVADERGKLDRKLELERRRF